MSQLNLYRIEKDQIRENLNKYTRNAFKLLPKLEKPHILDIGCGTGVPTIELVQISGGNVTGLDNDATALDFFKKKIDGLGLNNQITVINDSIFAMDFPEESFDIIWAEGSVFVMGFENSIKKWGHFLKPEGFLVIHDEDKSKNEKLKLVKKYDYEIIAEFDLSPEIWWEEYFTPLEKLVKDFRDKYSEDLELIKELNQDQNEIDQCRLDPVRASSFVVILQKK